MTTLDTSKPIETSLQTVKKEWCDYNGHMNVAYYSLAFENANFEAQEMMNMGEAYIKKDRRGLFSMKNVFTYQQEVGEGDPLRILYRVMDYSPKLLHILLEMYHAEKSYLACFTEQLVAHVDREERRTTPMTQDKLDMLEALKNAQSGLPLPMGIGEGIAIRRK